MEPFDIQVVFGTVVCKGSVVNIDSNVFQITMSDTAVASILKNNGRWKLVGELAVILDCVDLTIIKEAIEDIYFESLCNNSVFCSECSPILEKSEIDLFSIALNLKPMNFKNFYCYGCNNRSIYKDKRNLLFIAKQEQAELKLYPINLEDLIG